MSARVSRSRRPSWISVLQAISVTGDDAPSSQARIDAIKSLPADESELLIQHLLEKSDIASETIHKLSQTNTTLHDLVQKLSSEPWHVATFMEWAQLGDRRLARVSIGGEERLVSVNTDLDTTSLGKGMTVFLSAEKNSVIDFSLQPSSSTGQISKVSRCHGDGKLIVREHDQEVTLSIAVWLLEREINEGEQVRWCPRTRMVVEVIETDQVNGVEQLSVELTDPPVEFAGYAHIREGTLDTFARALDDPDLAARYGVNVADSTLLLHGPPGCGKTLLARTIARQTGFRFFVINASSIYDPYVGVTERQLVDAFRVARAAAPAILFFDEIDAIGRIRGGRGQEHSDRVTSVLLTQMDGAAGSPGIAIIGACNRVDIVDSGVRSRFSSEFKLVPPRRDAIREIAAVHLCEDLPFEDEDARNTCINALVSSLTNPNADNRIATLKLRDNSSREVTSRDLVSGRAIKQIVDAGCKTAFLRASASKGSDGGLRSDDIVAAVDDRVRRWRDMLDVSNVNNYVADLPDDVDVVSVQPHVNEARPGQYMNGRRA